MYQLHPANRRGRTYTGWLDSYHTFSFGSYHDPRYMNFGSLRVINDDIVAPGAGFDMHPHDNMEIVSIVLRGKLQHRDNLGNGDVLKPGDVQKMTAGSGIIHSEFNPSDKEPVHFLQIWIIPNMLDLRPSYEQKAFNRKSMTNRLTLLVSPDGLTVLSKFTRMPRYGRFYWKKTKTPNLPLITAAKSGFRSRKVPSQPMNICW